MYFGVNCIQTFYLGRYIVGYRVANLSLPGHACSTENVISDGIFDVIIPHVNFPHKTSIEERLIFLTITSCDFRQYI